MAVVLKPDERLIGEIDDALRARRAMRDKTQNLCVARQ